MLTYPDERNAAADAFDVASAYDLTDLSVEECVTFVVHTYTAINVL